MAMTKCGECGHSVSTQAKSCPSCGAQLKGKVAGRVETVVKWVVVGVVAAFVAALALSYGSSIDSGNQQYIDNLQREMEELERSREQGQ